VRWWAAVGKVRGVSLEKILCLVCSSTRTKQIGTTSSTSVFECRDCTLTFCWPLPEVESESAGAHSITTEESFTSGILSIDPRRQRVLDAVAGRRHERYRSVLETSDYTLLEVGCGAAGLEPGLRRLGVDYHGMDLDPRPIDAAQARGVANLTVGNFMEVPVKRQYDVIFMTQVLEHITHPREMVERLYASLVPGGILHLDVPNQGTLAGWPSRLLRGSGPRLGAIDHPHHSIAYTPRALEVLLRPLFDVRTFTANSDDPVWGQAGTPGPAARAYFAAQRVFHGRSLAVAFGRSRTT